MRLIERLARIRLRTSLRTCAATRAQLTTAIDDLAEALNQWEARTADRDRDTRKIGH